MSEQGAIPPFGLAEAEEAEDRQDQPGVEGLPLAEVECPRCGAVQVVVPITHVPGIWCGACRPVALDFPARSPELYPVLAGPCALYPAEVIETTYGPEPKRKAIKGEAYPAPRVTSRDPWDGAGTPSAVEKQAESARAASWDVRVQRSRGNAPHASHGAPGALKWRHAIVLRRGDAAAYAVHDGAGWASVMLWSADRPWFPYASITDLGEYVEAGGKMDDRWFAAIRERVSGSAGRAKARAACNVGRHGMVSIDGDIAHCSVCGNEWHTDGEPWRRVVTGKKEGAR